MIIDSIDRILEVVRTSETIQGGWQDIIEILDTTEAKSLPEPPFRKDFDEMEHWLHTQLSNAPEFSGIYLGLGEASDGNGTTYVSVEIAVSEAADPDVLDSEWIFHCPWYGEGRTIDGTGKLMTRIRRRYEAMGNAHYVVPLGYSGLLLSAALDRIEFPRPALVMWGFHDGDMFYLGRGSSEGFDRICRWE